MTAVRGKPSVINYETAALNPRRIYAFIQGENGHLFVRYSDGATWRWADQGAPPGTTMSNAPSAISLRSGPWLAPEFIYAFIGGTNGHLFVNYWEGVMWKWADLGVPPGTTMSGTPAAITYPDSPKTQHICAFVQGANGHQFLNYWDGVAWKWVDQGWPPGIKKNENPAAKLRGVTTCSVIDYRESIESRQISVFVSGSSSVLVNHVNNDKWEWLDKLDEINFTPCFGDAVTYLEGTESRMVQAFLTDVVTKGNPFRSLYTIDGDGATWTLSKRSEVTTFDTPYVISGTPGVTTYPEAGKPQRVLAFITNPNGHLLAYYRTSNGWHWADHGTPQ
ncbi:MAG: hypothetical protein ACRDTG_20410 [Pseudonocardiaceae bacterium]